MEPSNVQSAPELEEQENAIREFLTASSNADLIKQILKERGHSTCPLEREARAVKHSSPTPSEETERVHHNVSIQGVPSWGAHAFDSLEFPNLASPDDLKPSEDLTVSIEQGTRILSGLRSWKNALVSQTQDMQHFKAREKEFSVTRSLPAAKRTNESGKAECVMSDVPPMEGFLQQQLECIVCRNVYNLETRTPTALKCQHTFCKSCVDTLATKPPLTCPKCKRTCKVDNLKKNFAVCDILEKLCSSCNSREIEAQCEHCDQHICAICLDAHMQILEGKHNLDQLRQEIRKSAELTLEETALETERRKATDTICKIKMSISSYQQEIQKLEDALKSQVDKIMDLNIQHHTIWQKKMTLEMEKCKAFLNTLENRLGTKYGKSRPTISLVEINKEALKLLSELRDTQQSTPTPVEYKFVGSQSVPDVGEIVSTPARSIAVSGTHGGGPEQFQYDAYVACTDHNCIVLDTANHRVKVYDMNLNLMLIFGDKGYQKHQFNRPRGLCVSPCGELYVSDSGNDRIKVYSKHFQHVRTFGSKGSGNDEMNRPMGLAFTQTGQLLVADYGNYRVKVLSADGSYIRSIGSEGTGPGKFVDKPVSVASTPDGHVLVNEWNTASLLMFTLRGDYVRDITPSVPNLQRTIQIWGFTTDSDGNIIIGDCCYDKLIVYDGEGQLMYVVGRRGDQPGELGWPWSVAMNSNRILVYMSSITGVSNCLKYRYWISHSLC